jgi:TPR repeat protein
MSLRLVPALLAALAALVPGGRASRAAEPTQGKKYALLVGVTEYESAHFARLRYTENDVEELAALLARPGAGFTSVRVLSTARGRKDPKDAPTAANIRKALDALLAGKGKRDLALLALAGHGVQLEVKDPEGEKEPKSYGYFCPADARLTGVKFTTGFSRHLLHVNDTFEAIGRCDAGTKLVLIDACRNELSVKAGARSVDLGRVTIPRGVGALFSCKPGQKSFETADLGNGHGVFFYHVIEGLRGKATTEDREVTWDSLVGYVRRQVPRAVPKLLGGGARQDPHLMTNLTDSPVLARAGGAGGSGGAGEADALYRQGLERALGVVRPLDEAEAVRLFRRAADKGHAEATAALAFLLQTGQGVAADAEEAGRLARKALPGLRRAAEGGAASAANWLGLLYQEGVGLDGDAEEAVAWFRKAADKGYADALDNLGNAYLNGQGVEQDDDEALSWYRKAAEKGLPSAFLHLGVMHQQGRGTNQDEKEAVRWYRKAAAKGLAEAMNALGDCYRDGAGVARDFKEALRWFRRAAEKGFPAALLNLGVMYENGWGVAKDLKAAVRWYRAGAAKGDPNSENALANCYFSGTAVGKDYKEAVRLYRLAADKGHAAATGCLGVMYLNGWGVGQDKDEGLRRLEEGAEGGDPGSMNYLGNLYLAGQLVAQDYDKAFRLYEQAAEAGYTDAEVNLGAMYANGWGVTQDTQEAIRWYKKAAGKGHAVAKKRLAELTDES